MTSIPDLEAKRRKVHEVFSKADAALHKGTISKEQRDVLLHHYYGAANEQQVVKAIDEEIASLKEDAAPETKSIALVAGFSILMLSLFGVLFYSTGGITGAVVLDITEVNETYNTSTAINILLDGATRINVSGTASGNVTITLNHDGTSYEIFSRSSLIETAHANIAESHLVGEPVTFTVQNLSSAYLVRGEESELLNSTTIAGLETGDYTLRLLINDTELTYELLQFSVIEPGTVLQEHFNTCGEACALNISGNATLELTVDGALELHQIIISTQENNPPQLLESIPDASGAGNVTIDLGTIFSDPDGDALVYESTDHEENDEQFEEGTFIVTGEPGTYTYIIYASDLAEITPSNIFSVTLSTNDTTNETAETVINETILNETGTGEATNETVTNETSEPTNITINQTIQPENNTAPHNETAATLGCSDPDPNKRPLECIQNASSTYFRPEEIIIESKDAVQVGKLTPIGNLLIKGAIVEYSTGTAGSRDWTRGYADSNGDFVPTVWIDGSTGDLHLRGSLTEANGNIIFEPGYSALMNERDIILALIDTRDGNLIVRGNVIPYRRSFE